MAEDPTDTPITLPGRLAGVLTVRRCSPVVHETIDHENWDGDGEPPLVKVRAVLGMLRFWGVLASVSYEMSGVPLQEDEVPVEELALDLEDETGRTHAVWHLQDRSGTARRRGVQSGFYSFGRAVPRGRSDRDRFIRFTIGQGVAWGPTGNLGGRPVCPGLDGLDPDDPTLLPDGSRRVDALALQAVCMHVGGGQ